MAYEYIEHYAGMGFRVGLVSRNQVPPHFHSDYELLYSLQGTASVIMPSGRLELHAGECLIVEKSVLHMYSQEQPALIIYLNINPTFCSSYFPEFSNFYVQQTHVTARSNPVFLQAYQEFMYLFFQEAFSPQADTNLKLMSGLTKICALMISDLHGTHHLAEISAKREATNDRLSKILNYVLDNHTRKITLTEISQIFHMDMYYLSHFIHKHVGVSFQNYLARIRLDHALRLIEANPAKKLADIAYEAGFSDVRYLNKAIEESFRCKPDNIFRQYLDTSEALHPSNEDHLNNDSFDFLFASRDLSLCAARSQDVCRILRQHMQMNLL